MRISEKSRTFALAKVLIQKYKGGTIMSTVALQNIWDTLLGYNLSTANKRWLAEHLWEQIMVETAEQVEPYTMEELNARIDQSEADIAAGRVYSREEARRHRKEYMAKLLNS